MTISSTLRRAGPFTGNSVVTTFPFAFKVFDKTNVLVVRTDSNAAGAQTILVLDSDYSVTLNADQNANPGGTILYPLTGTALLSSTQQLTTIGSLAYLQPTALTNNGGFYPAVVEDALDREVILSQQLQEIVSRAIVLPITESNPPQLPPAAQRANSIFGFDALGNLSLMPLTVSVGAGALTPEVKVNGVDFTAGTSNSITLGKLYGTKANLGTLVMAGIAQNPNSYSLNGLIVTFDAVIPLGVDAIWLFGGTTLSTQIPPDGSVTAAKMAAGSVGDSQLLWGAILPRIVASVAAMQNLNVATYQRANTNGYYPGGPGGAEYYYDPAYAQSNANGFTTITSLTGTGCWRMLPRGVVDLFHAGAKGDDIADDTAPVNAAITWCIANGVKLRVPAAPKAFRLTSTINIVGNLRMEGDGVMPYTDVSNVVVSNVTIGAGPWFHINHAGKGFSSVNAANNNKSTTFYKGIGTYRDQPTPNGVAAFTPNNNDWDFYNDTVDLHMDDVFCLNPTKFSYTTGGSRASYYMVRGQPLTYGIQTDYAADVCKYDQIRFWAWWSQAQGVWNWTLANARAFIFARNDTPMLSNLFTIFYNVALYITSNAFGNTTGLKCNNTDFDAGMNGLLVDASVHGFDGMFTNFRTQGYSAASGRGVYLVAGSSNCEVRFDNFRAGFYGTEGVRVDGSGNVVWMGANSKVDQWNLSNIGFPAFGASATNTLRFAYPPYTVAPTGTTTPVGGAGVFKGKLIDDNVFNGSTDGNGQVTIVHNLGVAPLGAVGTVINGTVGITLQVVSTSTTTVVFQFRTATTNASLVLAAIGFTYQFVY